MMSKIILTIKIRAPLSPVSSSKLSYQSVLSMLLNWCNLFLYLPLNLCSKLITSLSPLTLPEFAELSFTVSFLRKFVDFEFFTFFFSSAHASCLALIFSKPSLARVFSESITSAASQHWIASEIRSRSSRAFPFLTRALQIYSFEITFFELESVLFPVCIFQMVITSSQHTMHFSKFSLRPSLSVFRSSSSSVNFKQQRERLRLHGTIKADMKTSFICTMSINPSLSRYLIESMASLQYFKAEEMSFSLKHESPFFFKKFGTSFFGTLGLVKNF